MRHTFPDAMVDCAGLDPDDYPSPDPEDRLIIGAAHRSPADTIVTRNLADFPDSILMRYGLRTQTPDSLMTNLLATEPTAVMTALNGIMRALKNAPLTMSEILANLAAAGAPGFAVKAAAMIG